MLPSVCNTELVMLSLIIELDYLSIKLRPISCGPASEAKRRVNTEHLLEAIRPQGDAALHARLENFCRE